CFFQPSKKKGTSQKSAKAKTPTLINGLTVEEMSKEQIEEHIARLREEVDREREERNYFQLERDEVDTFREVSDRKLEVINSEKFTEDDEERFQEEIRVYKLKIKHLLCEHENTISELKADGLVTAEVQQKEQEQLKRELLKKKRAIMVDMEELNSDIPIRELEQEKSSESILEMIEDGDTPSVMQDTVSAEPVTKVVEDVVKRTKFTPPKKDSILKRKKALEDLKLKHEIMEQKLSKLQLERDELFSSFPQKIQSLEDEAELGNTVLKRKLQALTDNLEKTQAQLYSLLSAPNMDHTGLSVLTNQILDNLEFRKSAIKNLECQRKMISELKYQSSSGHWWEECRKGGKGSESQSDGEIESPTQEEVSAEC
ncbi:dynein regulatory complex subunit 4, partial [Xenentodon cancila]